MAGNHALLTLLRGQANSMGLCEIRFHYPFQGDREKTLAQKAIETINQYHFQIGFHWALVEEKNHKRFLDHLRTIPGASQEALMIPDDIMHGKIGFEMKFRFDGYQYSDKDALVQKIMDGGIPPRDKALDTMFGMRKKDMECLRMPLGKEEVEAEIRRTFARNLELYSD
ncbi:hypothetical protein KKE75_01320 [Patescibacteria group bacterium]|nr:hypothetical protein [Patescibacteria group bacterium]